MNQSELHDFTEYDHKPNGSQDAPAELVVKRVHSISKIKNFTSEYLFIVYFVSQ